ncbi:MAG: hypothetical protein LUO86_04920, partial [Methanomicrobiales archaeon]|nr:hypothetical protein [Methanomicrobiales archaeon]
GSALQSVTCSLLISAREMVISAVSQGRDVHRQKGCMCSGARWVVISIPLAAQMTGVTGA